MKWLWFVITLEIAFACYVLQRLHAQQDDPNPNTTSPSRVPNAP